MQNRFGLSEIRLIVNCALHVRCFDLVNCIDHFHATAVRSNQGKQMNIHKTVILLLKSRYDRVSIYSLLGYINYCLLDTY